MSAAAAATASRNWRVITTPAQTEEWGTPPILYATLDREFHFTLDAAAGCGNAQHVRYFTRKESALEQSWADERVFCNPPYGKELPAWLDKARREARDHNALVVMLLPARTDTRWFHRDVLGVAEIRFLRGRLNYRRVRGSGHNSRAPFASMVVIYRPGREQTPAPSEQMIFGFRSEERMTAPKPCTCAVPDPVAVRLKFPQPDGTTKEETRIYCFVCDGRIEVDSPEAKRARFRDAQPARLGGIEDVRSTRRADA